MDPRLSARRLAIVIPWFGGDLKGGAEQQAWQIASRLAARGYQVDVLTTCCRSHQDDWATNHLREGVTAEREGFSVRRFRVDPRDRESFDQVCNLLQAIAPAELKPGVSPISEEASSTFVSELIKSSELLNYLKAEKECYRWFLFLPYLYGPVLQGIAITAGRAALQPCLHDEAYAYLPEVARAFETADKLLFNSDGELELALRLFGPGIWSKSTVVGEGVESNEEEGLVSDTGCPELGRFVLYLGRKESGKNVDMLLRAFHRFRAVRPNSALCLVLAGHGTVNLENLGPAAVDMGLVSDASKEELLRSCVALLQPSQHESYSRVMMEAWLHGRPVAAHSRCLATAVAVERSGGGWLADSEDEWAALLVEIDRVSTSDLSKMGTRGRLYAQELADWNHVIDLYEETLNLRSPHSLPSTRVEVASEPISINQFLPNLSYGDAISNHAIWIKKHLQKLGYQSSIFARYIEPRVEKEVEEFSPAALHASTAIIYHHSIGTEITPQVLGYAGRKCLVYHNITPAKYFLPYRPDFAAILEEGREALPTMASSFSISVGDSLYNASELSECGFHRPGVLPICIRPDKWSAPPDTALMRQLQDGRTNLLFVGRVAPSKKQDDLLEAFRYYLSVDPTARLILVGHSEHDDAYDKFLRRAIHCLALKDSVIMPGSITDAKLNAYYRTAHLFWSMSEHEGFCVPLIEAMWFDVPVLAFKSSAVPETLGDAAVMFDQKEDLGEIAALARVLTVDRSTRERIFKAQRKRRLAYLPDKAVPLLEQLVKQLLHP